MEKKFKFNKKNIIIIVAATVVIIAGIVTAVLLSGSKKTENKKNADSSKKAEGTDNTASKKYVNYEGQIKTYDLADNKKYEAPENDDSYKRTSFDEALDYFVYCINQWDFEKMDLFTLVNDEERFISIDEGFYGSQNTLGNVDGGIVSSEVIKDEGNIKIVKFVFDIKDPGYLGLSAGENIKYAAFCDKAYQYYKNVDEIWYASPFFDEKWLKDYTNYERMFEDMRYMAWYNDGLDAKDYRAYFEMGIFPESSKTADLDGDGTEDTVVLKYYVDEIDETANTVGMNKYSDAHIEEYYEGCERIIVNKGKDNEAVLYITSPDSIYDDFKGYINFTDVDVNDNFIEISYITGEIKTDKETYEACWGIDEEDEEDEFDDVSGDAEYYMSKEVKHIVRYSNNELTEIATIDMDQN